jgi:hypothetical protein
VLVAHTTIVFTCYIMLAMGQRTSKGLRTVGSLFHAGCDEFKQVSFNEMLYKQLGHFQQVLKGIPAAIAGRLQILLDSFDAGILAM